MTSSSACHDGLVSPSEDAGRGQPSRGRAGRAERVEVPVLRVMDVPILLVAFPHGEKNHLYSF